MWIGYVLLAATRFIPSPADDASIREFVRRSYDHRPADEQVWSERMRLPARVVQIYMLTRDVAEGRGVQSEIGSVVWSRREIRLVLGRAGGTGGLRREFVAH